MSCLTALPVELLDNIAEHLCLPEGSSPGDCCLGQSFTTPAEIKRLAALACLARTSKLLQVVAQPKLFRYLCPKGHPAVVLRTLRTRPDLAAAVRHLCVSQISYVDTTFDREVPDASAIFDKEMLANNQDMYSMRLFGLLPVSLVPTIRSLCLPSHDSRYLAVKNMSLPGLTELTVHCPFASVRISELQPIFDAAPALQVVRAQGIFKRPYEENKPGDFHHARLAELHITEAHLFRGCFEAIMTGFPSLSHFSYVSGGEIVHEPSDEASPRAMLKSLQLRKDTLKHVLIDLSRLKYYYGDDDNEGLPSLAGMPFLESLHLTGVAIFGQSVGIRPERWLQDFLPPRIRSLGIDRADEDSTATLVRLAEVASECFPLLKEVHLSNTVENVWLQLESVFAHNGIVCGEGEFFLPYYDSDDESVFWSDDESVECGAATEGEEDDRG